MSGVTTNLTEGSAVVRGLHVKNAEGFLQTNALEIDSFSASIDYKSREIKEIIIDKPIINAELMGGKNNFQELLKNIPDSEDSAENEGDQETIITIRRLLLSNATVNLNTDNAKIEPQSFVMEDMLVNNLSGTSEQIAETLSRELSNHVSGQVKSYMRELVLEHAQQKLRNEASKRGGKLRDSILDRLKPKKPSEEP